MLLFGIVYINLFKKLKAKQKLKQLKKNKE